MLDPAQVLFLICFPSSALHLSLTLKIEDSAEHAAKKVSAASELRVEEKTREGEATSIYRPSKYQVRNLLLLQFISSL